MGQPKIKVPSASRVPRVTLKSVKFYDRLSEETIAFSATVYLDGKRVGDAQNDGHGGNTSVMVPHDLLPVFEEIASAIAPIVVDGKTRCCGAGVVTPYPDIPKIQECATCKRMIHVQGEPYPDGAMAYVIDQLVNEANAAREEKKLQRIDRRENEANALRGCLTLRWTDGTVHVWSAIKPGQTPDEVGEHINKTRKSVGTWRVVS